MSPRSSKFALIWWVECKQIDIIPSTQLPKNHKGIGSVVKLMWKDSVNGKSERFEAKILALGASQDEMEQIIVDSNGQICSPGAEVPTTRTKRSGGERNRTMETRKKLKREKNEILKSNRNLPLLNLNPSTSTSKSTLPESTMDSHSSVNDEAMESDSPSESSSEGNEFDVRAFNILGKVTLQDVEHMEKLVQFMKRQYEFQQRHKRIFNEKK